MECATWEDAVLIPFQPGSGSNGIKITTEKTAVVASLRFQVQRPLLQGDGGSSLNPLSAGEWLEPIRARAFAPGDAVLIPFQPGSGSNPIVEDDPTYLMLS